MCEPCLALTEGVPENRGILIVGATLHAKALRGLLAEKGIDAIIVGPEDLGAPDALHVLCAREVWPEPTLGSVAMPRANQPWYRQHSARNGKLPRY